MQADELARLLHARRSGKGRWRSKCPIHRSKGLTLAIYADPARASITCYAGCSSDDILAKLGLSWRDTLYRDDRLTPEEKREWAKKKYIAELYERERRLMDLRMFLRGVEMPAHRRLIRTQSRFERDIDEFCTRIENRPDIQRRLV